VIGRRTLLAGAAAALTLPGLARTAVRPVIGVQLFMVLEAARRDLPGTLKTLSAFGYREVELLAGLADVTTMKASLGAARLSARSIHVPPAPFLPGMPSLATDLDGQIAYAQALGLDTIVCAAPYLPPARLAGVGPEEIGQVIASMTSADWIAHCDFLNNIAPICRRAGLRLAHHNHASEFTGASGQTGFDILLERTRPDAICFELDCGWALASGADPIALLRRHGPRIRLLHLKDVVSRAGMRTATTELGRGIADWRAILGAAARAGVEAAYVEQEQPMADAFASAQADLNFLDHLGVTGHHSIRKTHP